LIETVSEQSNYFNMTQWPIKSTKSTDKSNLRLV